MRADTSTSFPSTLPTSAACASLFPIDSATCKTVEPSGACRTLPSGSLMEGIAISSVQFTQNETYINENARFCTGRPSAFSLRTTHHRRASALVVVVVVLIAKLFIAQKLYNHRPIESILSSRRLLLARIKIPTPQRHDHPS